MHDWLVAHGYEFVGRRGGGHFEYRHDGQPMYLVSDTAYDAGAWPAFRSEMRRRHPGVFKERRSERVEGPRGPSQAQRLVAWATEEGISLTLEQARKLAAQPNATERLLVREGRLTVVVPESAKPRSHVPRPEKAKPQPRQPWEPRRRAA